MHSSYPLLLLQESQMQGMVSMLIGNEQPYRAGVLIKGDEVIVTDSRNHD